MIELGLRKQKKFSELSSHHAEALFLKTCLELGRLRPATSRFFSLKELIGDIQTIEEIINTPLEMPLPKKQDFDPTFMQLSDYSVHLEKARGITDYHLAISYRLGDLEYQKALRKIGNKYLNLLQAFKIISQLEKMSEEETIFLKKFEKYTKMIN